MIEFSGHRVPARRQPPDEPEARAARASAARRCSRPPARCCSRPRCSTRSRSWSSAAASARSRTSTSTCSARAQRAVRRRDLERRRERAEVVTLMEITMRNLRDERRRAATSTTRLSRPRRRAGRRRGKTVLISDYFEYYRLAAYLAPLHQEARSASRWAPPACAICSTRSTTRTSRAASSNRSGGCSRTTCSSTSTRSWTGDAAPRHRPEAPGRPAAPGPLRPPRRERLYREHRFLQPGLPADLLPRRPG